MHKKINDNNISTESFDMNFQQLESTNNILSNIENKLNSFLSKKPSANVLKKKSSKSGFPLQDSNQQATQSHEENFRKAAINKEKRFIQGDNDAAPRRLFNNEMIAERITTKSITKKQNYILFLIRKWKES